MDDALHEYAHNLSPMKITHPLDRDNYESLSTKGGGMIAEPKKPWDEYATWNELETDEGALDAYFIQRKTVHNKPNLDWGPVLAEIDPKLKENREYIGIVNVMADGKTLKLVAYEGSPSTSDDEKSTNAFASVPAELVAKYASRPGLFLFHTHPADIRGCPLPSTQDIATAIHFGAASQFAANVVISRYGVLMYGLDWSAYKAINESKNQHLATLNYGT